VKGRLILNGNMGDPGQLVERVKPWLLSARGDGQPPRVLLVTAAWGPREYDEGAVREALNGAGVPSDWQGGHDRAIANLCAWHAWRGYLDRHPEVAAVDGELREVEEATRQFYVEKTSFHGTRIRRAVEFTRSRLPSFRLGDLPLQPREHARPAASLDARSLLARALARELVHDIMDLVENDHRMMATLGQAGDTLAERTGLWLDEDWRAERARLEARVLGADAVLFFGGDPGALLHALRFFDLRPALREALRRGATFLGVSAGSLVLCERMIVYDNFHPDPARREFRLVDRGMALVPGLQVLPHCMDRIHTDDEDNLAYLARRFSSRVCVGLNQESFLLLQPGVPSATSVGEHDGVYVFGPDGRKRRYGRGDAVPVG
jgi:hypothetical protein